MSLDGRALARVESIASAAYSELTAALPEIVWSPIWSAQVPFERVLKRISRMPCSYPPKLETLLAEQTWFGGAEPLAADFFVFEGLAAWRAILGEPYVAMIANLPQLAAWWERVSARVETQTFARSQFTASPYETELFSRARERSGFALALTQHWADSEKFVSASSVSPVNRHAPVS